MKNCYYPTKEQLENDYFILNLSQDQIGSKYGFSDRQPIGRLFKKYDIKTKGKSQLSLERQKEKIKNKKPSKEKLQNDLSRYSQVELSKSYDVSVQQIRKWMNEYNIKTSYFKNHIDTKTIQKCLNEGMSPKEISIKENCNIRDITFHIKYHNLISPKKIYDLITTKNKCDFYIKNHSQGIVKSIEKGDPNLLDSILFYTKKHKLQSNKLTERIYRIVNDVESDVIFKCVCCCKDLKFYTLNSGYGYSEITICKDCINSKFTNRKKFSNGSIQLFEKIDEYFENTLDSYFGVKNREVTIKTNKYCDKYSLLNKTRIYLDFFEKTKKMNIEYDGEYWHNPAKDKERDLFLLNEMGIKVLRINHNDYIKNPEQQLKKCIIFLNQ